MTLGLKCNKKILVDVHLEESQRSVDDKNVTNREILNLRKLRNTQNLALKRIQQDKLRLVRDKELIDRKKLSVLNKVLTVTPHNEAR